MCFLIYREFACTPCTLHPLTDTIEDGGKKDSADLSKRRLRNMIDAIYNVNCLDGLQELPGGIVDLTVTSPPYYKLRKYNGEFVWNMEFFSRLAPE